MAITIYYSPMSSAVRVLWALEELGIPYEKKRVHIDKGETRTPEFLAINPNGQVPALVDGDAKMFESSAILMHLGEKYGVEKNLWFKPGTTEKAEAMCWTAWGSVQMFDCVIQQLLHTSDMHFALPKQHQNPEIVRRAGEQWSKLMNVLDKRLNGREWTVGNHFSICDLANASIVGFGTMMAKLPLNDFRNVQGWLQRCTSRPAFAKAQSIQ